MSTKKDFNREWRTHLDLFQAIDGLAGRERTEENTSQGADQAEDLFWAVHVLAKERSGSKKNDPG
jgi:hypothetical protein